MARTKSRGSSERRLVHRVINARKIRKAQKKTLEEVAAQMGITHATLGRMERGLLPYKQPHLEALSRILKVDIPTLLGHEVKEIDESVEILDIMKRATPREREMIVDLAHTVIKRR